MADDLAIVCAYIGSFALLCAAIGALADYLESQETALRNRHDI